MVMGAVPKIEEGGELAVGPQKHIPAFSPVAAVGTSAGNVFFPAKADTAVSAIAGLNEDSGFIDKLDRSDSRSSRTPAEPGWQRRLGLNPLNLGRINADLLPFPVQPFEGHNAVDLGE